MVALYAPLSTASAEGPQPEHFSTASWVLTGPTPSLHIDGPPDAPVTIQFRAALGNLDHSWEQEAGVLSSRGELDVELTSLTTEGVLDIAAADYVTDLVVVARVAGESARAERRYLAWPDGTSADPALWTRDQMREQAPNGVLRADVEDDNVRIMPNLGDNTRTRTGADTAEDR